MNKKNYTFFDRFNFSHFFPILLFKSLYLQIVPLFHIFSIQKVKVQFSYV